MFDFLNLASFELPEGEVVKVEINGAVVFEKVTDIISFTINNKEYQVSNGSTWEDILNNSNSELSKDGYFWDDYGNPVWYTDNRYIVIYESNNGMAMPQETIIANENYRLEGYPVEIIINGKTVQAPGLTNWLTAIVLGWASPDFTGADGDAEKVLYKGEYLIGPDGEEVIGMHQIITGGEYTTESSHYDEATCPVCDTTYNGAEHGNYCPSCQEFWIVCGNCDYVASEGEWNAPEAGNGHCPSCGQ